MGKITIVGLGLIGTSIGLGLKKANLKDIEIVGTDKDSEVSSRASKMGAIDKASRDLIPAIQDTNMVILATPVMAMKELMEIIGPHLEEGATVTDTGSTKSSVMAWAEEYLPSSVSFVGGHPMAGKEKSGPDAAEATLFNNTPYCIIPGKQADPSAVKSVAGLAEILGAKPMFMDAPEHDSFVAAISHLPMILSIALVTSTAKSPQWSEMARLASTGYRDITRLASGDPEMNRDICLTNADFLVRWVDEIIKELYEFRNNIKEGRESLLSTFVQAWEARARWLAGVTREEAKVELPTVGESFAGMLMGDRLARKVKEITSRDKKDPTKYYKR
ncbi:MAG: prephenate dehydrogenase/arogenate dehydrogenase family protein [Chloroflexi bacterium]|nr:prephenate dehydrogenase/arogenate dehydrogenase family protein [Chloroflexota bacterium]